MAAGMAHQAPGRVNGGCSRITETGVSTEAGQALEGEARPWSNTTDRIN